MAIEFSCQECGKLLRTTEDKAGLKAKCPQCGSPVSVPTSTAARDEPPEDEFSADEPWGAAPPVSRTGDTKPCPMCGEIIKSAAQRCRFCGEELPGARDAARGGLGQPIPIDVGSIYNRSWAIFQPQIGMGLAATIIVFVINQVASSGAQLVGGVIAGAIAQGDPALQIVAASIWLVVGIVLPLLLTFYLQTGQTIFFLKMVRGQNPEISDLFTGGPFLLRMFGASMLFALALILGLLAFIVPGVILALMFWPYAFVLVDQNPPGIDCLSIAKKLTAGQLGQLFVLSLAMMGINILGFLALCVGIVFTIPFTTVMTAVAYCDMAGRRTMAD